MQLVKVLYCKLTVIGKQLSTIPQNDSWDFNCRLQRWETSVLPLPHRCTTSCFLNIKNKERIFSLTSAYLGHLNNGIIIRETCDTTIFLQSFQTILSFKIGIANTGLQFTSPS